MICYTLKSKTSSIISLYKKSSVKTTILCLLITSNNSPSEIFNFTISFYILAQIHVFKLYLTVQHPNFSTLPLIFLHASPDTYINI